MAKELKLRYQNIFFTERFDISPSHRLFECTYCGDRFCGLVKWGIHKNRYVWQGKYLLFTSETLRDISSFLDQLNSGDR